MFRGAKKKKKKKKKKNEIEFLSEFKLGHEFVHLPVEIFTRFLSKIFESRVKGLNASCSTIYSINEINYRIRCINVNRLFSKV